MKNLTSMQNPVVKHLVKLRKDAQYRKNCKTVVIEGKRLVQDVCRMIRAKKLLVLENSSIPDGILTDELFAVSQEILDKIAGAKKTDAMVAEVSFPKKSSFEKVHRLLVLDRVQDPGNMGTLMRTALGFGFDAVFILKGSCDPFNDKTLRAAKGATFRIPFIAGSWDELEAIAEKNKLHMFAADIEGQSIDRLTVKDKFCLVMGNEAQGLSQEAQEKCQKITIPMKGQVESLNVAAAGAILMYALQ